MADSENIPSITITAADHAFFGSIFRSLGYRIEREVVDEQADTTKLVLATELQQAANSFDAWRLANGLTASGRGTPPIVAEKPLTSDTDETISYCAKQAQSFLEHVVVFGPENPNQVKALVEVILEAAARAKRKQ